MTDYDVKVQVIIHSGFDGKEFNDLLYETMKGVTVEHVKSLFEEDDALSSHVDGDLEFRFLDGYKVRLSYTFACHDENPAEEESFAGYCLKTIQEKLEEYGYRLDKMTFKAEEADVSFLKQMGFML